MGSRMGEVVAERLLVLSILVLSGIPAAISWAKGQRAAFVLGFLLLGMVWVVAACRLARPSSPWARRFYGPEKMRRAEARFGSATSTPSSGYS
jgi:hypothetical protein